MCLPLSSLEILFLNEWCFEVPVTPVFFLLLSNEKYSVEIYKGLLL